MLSVDDAITAILAGATALKSEDIPLTDIVGRVSAEDISARIEQPPFAASAMDGYAVRFEDAQQSARLLVIGEAPAGAPFDREIGDGEAVRIFTGGVVPRGANHVVIQEDVSRNGDSIIINEIQARPRNIRAAGIDFQKGDLLVRDGDIFHELHGSILAAANIARVSVRKRPQVTLFSNGDELKEPGAKLRPGEIINSNHYALTALIRNWGGEAHYLGCAADSEKEIESYFARARGADIVVPIGGASVGDYDFVKSAFRAAGGKTGFEKVAVRPGKPTWYGKIDHTRIIGLPGNPASAIVTAALFVQPLVRRLGGREDGSSSQLQKAILTVPAPANGARETYLRAKGAYEGGKLFATPAGNQDSSLLSPFIDANILIRRQRNTLALVVGDSVDIVWLR